MDINMNGDLVLGYSSGSQIARILTENWMTQNMYCPHCGSAFIKHCRNNQPVKDFYCPYCGSSYELKSKNGRFGQKVSDGSYGTMIEQINMHKNPDFFFLGYSRDTLRVQNLFFVPKYFFHPDMIEKRPPLAASARRAGWIGCNILIKAVPEQGRIPIIVNEKIIGKDQVIQNVRKSTKLQVKNLNGRGWLLDVLNCINGIHSVEFTLNDIYKFEMKLQAKYPNNHHIKAKIRQQLQFIRDKGFIAFEGNGYYRKLF